jgi:hypothetical protein
LILAHILPMLTSLGGQRLLISMRSQLTSAGTVVRRTTT